MATAGKKTVRFSQVVKRSGEPQVHTLWVEPAKDPELQRAKKAHRVMTIHASPSGGKTDVGVVGFDPEAGRAGQFLIFPKSLKAFAGARVVGIKFDLVEQPKLKPATVQKILVPAPFAASSPAAAKEPAKSTNARKQKADRVSPSADRERAPIVAFTTSADEKAKSAALEKASPPAPAAPIQAAASSKITAEALTRDVRAALRELKAGKAVAAYQRLERAIAK